MVGPAIGLGSSPRQRRRLWPCYPCQPTRIEPPARSNSLGGSRASDATSGLETIPEPLGERHSQNLDPPGSLLSTPKQPGKSCGKLPRGDRKERQAALVLQATGAQATIQRHIAKRALDRCLPRFLAGRLGSRTPSIGRSTHAASSPSPCRDRSVPHLATGPGLRTGPSSRRMGKKCRPASVPTPVRGKMGSPLDGHRSLLGYQRLRLRARRTDLCLFTRLPRLARRGFPIRSSL